MNMLPSAAMAVATALAFAGQTQAAAPAHAANITVYHVNPKHLGPKPINMDTGDSTGDLFFDLFEVMLYPLACPDGAATGGMTCTNPEANSPDLVVNKVRLEVDNRYSGYAKCNIGANGTDGHGNTCKDNTYCCFCASPNDPWGPPIPCNATLGHENLYDNFGNGSHSHGGGGHGPHHHFGCDGADFKAADCYRANVMKKLTARNPGNWYSSLKTGYCGDGEADARGGCTWRVIAVDKVVTRACHSKTFGDAVQASAPPACLNACGAQKTNTSSPCWTDCFYKAALGPGSGHPNGTVAGMPMADMVKAWEMPFLPVAEGGCPPMPQ